MCDILNLNSDDKKQQKDKLNGEKLQILWICVFSLLYILRDVSGVGFPDIIFSGFCAVVFLISDVGTALGAYMFTTALTLPNNEIRIFYIVILLMKILASKRLKFNSTLVVVTVAMLLLQLVDSALFSPLGTVNYFYSYVVVALNFVIPLIWFELDWKPKDFQRAMMCYVTGVVLGSAVILIITAQSVGWPALLQGEGMIRLGDAEDTGTAMRTSYNANQLSGMCAIALSILLIRIDKLKSRPLIKAICFLLVGYLFFIVLLTKSRTGLLMTALAILIYIWIVIVKHKRVLVGIAVSLSVAMIVVAVISMFPQIFENIISRFVNQDDITNGRTDLFIQYIEAWSSDLWCGLFGYGVGTYQNVVDIWDSPHNFFADVLICWGFTGLILIGITIWKFFKKGYYCIDKKDRLLALMPAIIAIVTSMADQYLTTGYPHIRVCFLLLAMRALAARDEEEEVSAMAAETENVKGQTGVLDE